MIKQYLIIEGVDCVGKSTQMRLLKEQFKDALFVHEPGFTKLGSSIRELIFDEKLAICKQAELFLFLADRAQLASFLKTKQASLVVSDRGFVSGMAYAKDLEFDLLLELNSLSLGGAFGQKIAFLKASKELLASRLALKTKDKIEKKGLDFLLGVQERIAFILSELKARELCTYKEIDASMSEEEINESIKEFLS